MGINTPPPPFEITVPSGGEFIENILYKLAFLKILVYTL